MQVLDIDIRGSDSVYLHATDYTTNSLLSVRDQFRHLQHGVLKIILRDSQAEIAKLLKPGDVCTFQKVIVKLVNKENVGDLGGDQLLVKRLNPSLSNEKILMQGLEEYVVAYARASQTCLTIFTVVKRICMIPRNPSYHRLYGRTHHPCSSPHRSQGSLNPSRKLLLLIRRSIPPSMNWSLLPNPGLNSVFEATLRRHSQINSNSLFGLIARIATKSKCCSALCYLNTNHDILSIPKGQKACVRCDDTDYEFLVFRYKFWVRVEEEGEDNVALLVDDNVSLIPLHLH